MANTSPTITFEWDLERKERYDESDMYDEDDELIESEKITLFGPEVVFKSDTTAKFGLYRDIFLASSMGLVLKGKLIKPKSFNIKGYLKFYDHWSHYEDNGPSIHKEYFSENVIFANKGDKWELNLDKKDKDDLSDFDYNGQSVGYGPDDIEQVVLCVEITELNPFRFKKTENSDSIFRKQLWEFSKNGLNTDLTIQVEDTEFKVHELILITQSNVFKTMLSEPKYKETQERLIKIEGFELDIFKKFIEWLYLGKVDDFNLNADKLFAVADKYEVKQLMDECAEELIETLTDKNLASRLTLSILHSHDIMSEHLIAFLFQKSKFEIMKFFVTPEWMEFAKSHDHLADSLMKKLEKKINGDESDNESEDEESEENDDDENGENEIGEENNDDDENQNGRNRDENENNNEEEDENNREEEDANQNV